MEDEDIAYIRAVTFKKLHVDFLLKETGCTAPNLLKQLLRQQR